MAGLFFRTDKRAAGYPNKFIQIFISRICILLFAVVLGGCPNNRGVGKSTTVDIPSTGGTITLEGIASVTFPNGAFPATQQVRLETTRNAATDELFQLSAVIFSPGARSTYEVRINTGDTQPQSDTVSVSLNIPSGLGDASTIQVFAQVFDGTANDAQDGYDELHDGFELYPSTLDAGSQQLQFELPWAVFSAGRLSDGSHEATLILAATEEVSESSGMSESALVSGSCPVSPIGPPLEQLTKVKNRGFNNTTKTTINGKTIMGHPGTDYVAQDGDVILAVGDGTVVQAVESNGKELMQDNGGAGGVVVISIPGTGMVRYMHLKKGSILVKKGDKVVCGQVIAAADNTGYSTKSHLHFELALGSNYMRNRVDLEPCLDENKCKDSFDGTFKITHESRYNTNPDDYVIQSVEGTLHWKFVLEGFYVVDGIIQLSRHYIATEITANVTHYEDSGIVCVGESPVSLSDPYGNGSLLNIYPTAKKYQMEIDLDYFCQATCTDKETGDTTNGEFRFYATPALAFNCTDAYIFPDDFIKYSIPENNILNDTYSLSNCITNDQTLTISGSWSFSKPSAAP